MGESVRQAAQEPFCASQTGVAGEPSKQLTQPRSSVQSGVFWSAAAQDTHFPSACVSGQVATHPLVSGSQ